MSSKRTDNGNGSLRKRSDGRWEGRCTIGYDPETGKQVQRSVYGKTQKEVRQKVKQILADLEDGTYVEPTSMTVGEWLDIWLSEYTVNIRPATKGAYEEHVRVHLKPYLGRSDWISWHPIRFSRHTMNFCEKEGFHPRV